MSDSERLYIRCPYCGSLMVETSKDGFDYKSAFWWSVFTDAFIGLLAGLWGRTKTHCRCRHCNREFTIDE